MTVAYYGIVDSLLHPLNFKNWMEIALFDCNLDNYCVQYNIFFVSRFQLNNLPFFSSTDESLCRNVTNKFNSNVLYLVGDRLIISFFHYVLAFI